MTDLKSSPRQRKRLRQLAKAVSLELSWYNIRQLQGMEIEAHISDGGFRSPLACLIGREINLRRKEASQSPAHHPPLSSAPTRDNPQAL
jgi:hypothetical protein